MARYKEITLKSNRVNAGTTGAKSQIYKGMSTVDPERSSSAMYDIELIKQDIINHFNIRKGEKIYNPEFGTIIWNALFDPLTEGTKDAITNDIKTIIDSDPRVKAKNVIVVQKDFGIQVGIELEYLTYSQAETLLLNFNKENGLLT